MLEYALWGGLNDAQRLHQTVECDGPTTESLENRLSFLFFFFQDFTSKFIIKFPFLFSLKNASRLPNVSVKVGIQGKFFKLMFFMLDLLMDWLFWILQKLSNWGTAQHLLANFQEVLQENNRWLDFVYLLTYIFIYKK